MALVGKTFPDMSVKAIDEMGDAFQINVLKQAVDNKKKVCLFWYPKDFTFVCPTEIHAFQDAAKEFEKRNTILIGASCDTAEVHFAWLSTSKDDGGIEGVQFPLIADSTRVLAMELDILDFNLFDEEPGDGDNVPYRATYLLDEEGFVFHEAVNHNQTILLSYLHVALAGCQACILSREIFFYFSIKDLFLLFSLICILVLYILPLFTLSSF